MNEPHDLLEDTPWFTIAQNMIDGIRTNDTKTRIVVGGDSWSSAERWMTYSDNLKNLSDTSNNLVFEAHVYFDDDASGIYNADYDTEGAYPNIGIDRVTPFVNWLQTNNLEGFVGEYGVPANDTRWLTVLDNFLSHLKENCINGTYWAGGPWWGDYILSVEPNEDTDKAQMTILGKHLTTNSSCAALNTSTFNSPNDQINTYPNPFNNHIFIKGLDNDALINIYDMHGRLVLSETLQNSTITNLEGLAPGVYLVKHKNHFIARIVK